MMGLMHNRSYLKPLLWILLLGFVATALHNFALSLSVDGALYANIAKNIIANHEWFLLSSGIPEFQPYFAEHPHLGFWVLACFVKVFGTGDWSMRILGHLLYVLTVFLFFIWIRRRENENSQTPVLFVVLLWVFPLFSRFYGQVYLDPLFFFFGVLAVFLLDLSLETSRSKNALVLALLAGAAVAFSGMTKGLSFLAFGPIMAFLCLRKFTCGNKRRTALVSVVTIFAMALVFFTYWLAVRNSSVPNFFETYWQRQWQDRFSSKFEWVAFFKLKPWTRLVADSNYLAVLVPIALAFRHFASDPLKRNLIAWSRFALPVVGLLSFTMMYFPAGKFGAQYSLAILPWVAWLIAVALDDLLGTRPITTKLVLATCLLAIVALMASQFVPLNLRKMGGPYPLAMTLKDHLDRFDRYGKEYQLSYIHTPAFGFKNDSFIPAANWSWYTKRDFVVTSTANLQSPETNIVVMPTYDQQVQTKLQESGFCLVQKHQKTSIWTGCGFKLLSPAHWSE